MIYSKFTENQEDNEETTLVTNSPATNTTANNTESSEESSMSFSVDCLSKASGMKTHVHIYSRTNGSTEIQTQVPYINRSHLKNLDTSNLERNIQVRHDLMIEEGYRASLPQLNVSEQEEEMYWNSIRIEVAELQTDSVIDAPRLRGLLSEIKEMMIELYPRCDIVTGEFSEFLEDTQFIVQQLKLGTLDIHGFFQFLGHVMKKNCAPKRDVLVDAMVSCACPIDGLKAALKLIELMKLDLANFKLDQLRPLIAKTAISTERSFFTQLFTSKRISLDLTAEWIRSHASPSASSAYEVFLDAGIRLLVSPFVKDSNCNVPETFILDKKRLISLHGKFQDLCIVQCLLLIFKQCATSSSTFSNKRKCFAATMLKGELLRLLEQPDTQISDISNLLIQCLKDSQVESINFDYIHSALNNIISPENELFLLIEGKLLHRIKSKLTGTTISTSGLSELNVLDEFDELIKKVGILLQYNWNVFEPIYQNLLSNENK